MKRIVAIFALVGILLQAFSQVVIVAQYYANKDFIAKNLCENRSKPSLHCDGKCCLKKKLAKEGKEQAPGPRNQKNEQVINLFCDAAKFEIKHFGSVVIDKNYFSCNDLRTASYQYSIFHPPTV